MAPEITAQSLEDAMAKAVAIMGNNHAGMGAVGRIVVISTPAPVAGRSAGAFDPAVGKLGVSHGRFEDAYVDLGKAQVRENSKDFYFQGMARCDRAHRLMFAVTNNLNQPTQVTVVGAVANQPEGAPAHFRIGEAVTVPSNDRTSITVDLGRFWHPWMGIVVLADTGVTAPTSGDVRAEAYLVNER